MQYWYHNRTYLNIDYDLNVLRGPPIYEDKIYRDLRQKEAHEVPDIGAFLTDKKDACDKDNDAYPIDDVRHYAYEGKKKINFKNKFIFITVTYLQRN